VGRGGGFSYDGGGAVLEFGKMENEVYGAVPAKTNTV
jgi:hypothetical protein